MTEITNQTITTFFEQNKSLKLNIESISGLKVDVEIKQYISDNICLEIKASHIWIDESGNGDFDLKDLYTIHRKINGNIENACNELITEFNEKSQFMTFDKLMGRLTIPSVKKSLSTHFSNMIIENNNICMKGKNPNNICCVCHDPNNWNTSCNHNLCFMCFDKIKPTFIDGLGEQGTACPLCRENISSFEPI